MPKSAPRRTRAHSALCRIAPSLLTPVFKGQHFTPSFGLGPVGFTNVDKTQAVYPDTVSGYVRMQCETDGETDGLWESRVPWMELPSEGSCHICSYGRDCPPTWGTMLIDAARFFLQQSKKPNTEALNMVREFTVACSKMVTISRIPPRGYLASKTVTCHPLLPFL